MSNGPDAPPTPPRYDTEAALIGVAIIVLAFALMPVQKRWAYNFPLIEHDRFFWTTMVLVFLGTVATAEAAWRFLWRRPCRYSLLVGWVGLVSAYNVFYPIANGALDRKTPQQRIYVITARDCWRQRPTMRLRPATTPDGNGMTLRVSKGDCEDASDGQELVLDVKPGFLGSPWIANYSVRGRNVEKPADPD